MSGRDRQNALTAGELPPSVPRLGCDLPIERADTYVHNELAITGWAISPIGIAGVVVQIDGRLLHAAYGLDTPWLAQDMPDMAGSDRAGYHLRLDTSGWSPGVREVAITAYDQRGERNEIAGTVDVLPFRPARHSVEDNAAAIARGEAALWVEIPGAPGSVSEVRVPVRISGWAYAAGGIDCVLVTIDGQRRDEALHPIFRPDLVEDYGEDVALGSGFELELHPRDCPPGDHLVTVVAVDRERRAVGMECDLTCLPPREPGGQTRLDSAASIEWAPRLGRPPRAASGSRRPGPTGPLSVAHATELELQYRLAAMLVSDRDVIDVGCGGGWGTATLAAAGARRAVGVDPAADPATPGAPPDEPLELVCAEPESLPFDDGSFDVLTCFGGLGEVTNLGVALAELRRVLRDGGVALISVSSASALDADGHAGGGPERLEELLGGHFGGVRVERAATFLTAVVADDAAWSTAGGGDALTLEVHKLGDGWPEHTLLAIASCGPAPPPALSPGIMIGPPSGVRLLAATISMWQDRALTAEANAAASRNQANLAQMHQVATLRDAHHTKRELAAARTAFTRARDDVLELSAQLAECNDATESHAAALAAAEERAAGAERALAACTSSLSWRMTQPVRAVKRGASRARRALTRIERTD